MNYYHNNDHRRHVLKRLAYLRSAPTRDFFALLREHQINPINDLPGCRLDGVKIRNADLTKANLRNTSLAGADLSGAILSHANLTNADLRGSDLRNTTLYKAVLKGARLEGAIFDVMNLRSATLPEGFLEDYYAITHLGRNGCSFFRKRPDPPTPA